MLYGDFSQNTLCLPNLLPAEAEDIFFLSSTTPSPVLAERDYIKLTRPYLIVPRSQLIKDANKNLVTSKRWILFPSKTSKDQPSQKHQPPHQHLLFELTVKLYAFTLNNIFCLPYTRTI